MVLVRAPAAHAQDEGTLALDYRAAQTRLVERSDAIDAAEANIRAMDAQERSTRTLARPTVEFEAQALRYQKTLHLPLDPLAALAEPFGIDDPLRFQVERTATRPIMTMTLPLYTGGQIPGVQAGARAQAAQSRAERDQTVEDALLQLSQLYFGQQLLAQAVGVRSDVLAGLERHVADALRLEREGFISRAQRLQAEVARDDAARELERAEAEFANADIALARMLRAPGGMRPISPLFVLSDALDPVDAFRREAFQAHPQIARLQALEDQAAAGVAIQRARLRPTVFAFGQYSLDRRDTLLNDPDWAVGVGLRYTLFSGEDRRQAVESAHQTALRAGAGLREAELQIDIGVTRAWNDAEAARRRFLLMDSAIVSADENLRVQRIAYREQQATSLDVVDAELAIGRARIQRAQAAHDYVAALARLLHMTGRIETLPDYMAQADHFIP